MVSNKNAPKYLGIELDRTLTFKQHLETVIEMAQDKWRDAL
jgi:hypothetical protein